MAQTPDSVIRYYRGEGENADTHNRAGCAWRTLKKARGNLQVPNRGRCKGKGQSPEADKGNRSCLLACKRSGLSEFRDHKNEEKQHPALQEAMAEMTTLGSRTVSNSRKEALRGGPSLDSPNKVLGGRHPMRRVV